MRDKTIEYGLDEVERLGYVKRLGKAVGHSMPRVLLRTYPVKIGITAAIIYLTTLAVGVGK